jgi:SGNH hydrolase-like domain, acetyltransferase AlgX
MKSKAITEDQLAETRGHRRPGFLSLKRLSVGAIFCLTLLALSGYGFIPGLFANRYIFLACAAICLLFVMIEPGIIVVRIALVLASLVVSVVLMDLTLRPVMYPRLFGPPQLFMFRWPPMPVLWRYKPNVVFDGMVYGDLASPEYQERRHEIFQTDSYGFRNTPAQEREAREGHADLILLGDSFGVGVGTTQEKTWGGLFQGKYGLHTYNLSIAGSGPWHELINLKIACQRLRCDESTTVLWALFSGNDLQDEIYDEMEPSLSNSRLRGLLVDAETFRNMSPIREIIDKVFVRGHSSPITKRLPDGRELIFRPRYVKAVSLNLEQVRQHPHYQKLAAVVDEMKRFADARHFSVVVVVAPAKEEIYSSILADQSESDGKEISGFASAIEELCRRDQLPYLDLKPFFAEESTKQLALGHLLWWSDDTHWNERGHELAAATVYDQLLRQQHSGSLRLSSAVQ